MSKEIKETKKVAEAPKEESSAKLKLLALIEAYKLQSPEKAKAKEAEFALKLAKL